MSSYTKSQFITHIKSRSSLLAGFEDATLSTFIDTALRAFSEKIPEFRLSTDNAFDSSENPVDLPDDCLDVYIVRDSSSKQAIDWNVVNEGDGDMLLLGDIQLPSYQNEIEQSLYIDPLQSASLSSVTFTSYDIQYSILQTMSTIKDTSLEAIYNHILYQACSDKAESIALSVSNQEIVSELRDTDASGAETAVKFNSSKEQVDNFTRLGESYLKKFEQSTNIAFGMRS